MVDVYALEGYECSSCGQVYVIWESATECCSSASALDIYVCGKCHRVYPYTEDADKCCA